MPKMVHFGEFLKTWSLRSNSVTRQVTFNRTKIGGKCQNSKIQMWHFEWFSNTVQWVYCSLHPQRFKLPGRKLKVEFFSHTTLCVCLYLIRRTPVVINSKSLSSCSNKIWSWFTCYFPPTDFYRYAFSMNNQWWRCSSNSKVYNSIWHQHITK